MHHQRLSWRQWIERASGRRRAMGGAGSFAGCEAVEAVEVAEAVEAGARRGRVMGTSTSKRSQASRSLGTSHHVLFLVFNGAHGTNIVNVCLCLYRPSFQTIALCRDALPMGPLDCSWPKEADSEPVSTAESPSRNHSNLHTGRPWMSMLSDFTSQMCLNMCLLRLKLS